MGYTALEEFASSSQEIERDKKYGGEAQELLIAMHEVIGHGSGKLSPKLTHSAGFYLKEYFSTLEEGRADLVALWTCSTPN
jgi:dipeptidyl-peptidase-3